MGAAILEQQEQQEKVAYKESFPTTPMKGVPNICPLVCTEGLKIDILTTDNL